MVSGSTASGWCRTRGDVATVRTGTEDPRCQRVFSRVKILHAGKGLDAGCAYVGAARHPSGATRPRNSPQPRQHRIRRMQRCRPGHPSGPAPGLCLANWSDKAWIRAVGRVSSGAEKERMNDPPDRIAKLPRRPGSGRSIATSRRRRRHRPKRAFGRSWKLSAPRPRSDNLTGRSRGQQWGWATKTPDPPPRWVHRPSPRPPSPLMGVGRSGGLWTNGTSPYHSVMH